MVVVFGKPFFSGEKTHSSRKTCGIFVCLTFFFLCFFVVVLNIGFTKMLVHGEKVSKGSLIRCLTFRPAGQH